MAAAWARLPLHLRTANQFLARQYAGCAATIGAMPRCDFACTGCYLGEGANRVPPLQLARRLDPRPWRFAWRWLRGRARVDYRYVVSHHFMSAAELATPLGRERVELCVFKVAIDDELVSMCEANAAGRRAAFYERTASEPHARQGAA